jgi:hypothetical protein
MDMTHAAFLRMQQVCAQLACLIRRLAAPPAWQLPQRLRHSIRAYALAGIAADLALGFRDSSAEQRFAAPRFFLFIYINMYATSNTTLVWVLRFAGIANADSVSKQHGTRGFWVLGCVKYQYLLCLRFSLTCIRLLYILHLSLYSAIFIL